MRCPAAAIDRSWAAFSLPFVGAQLRIEAAWGGTPPASRQHVHEGGLMSTGTVVSVHYEVPDVTLIIQDKDMACWFASAMMVLNWKEKRRGTGSLVCQNIDQATLKLYKANQGLQNSQVIPLAKRLGLVAVPPQSPSIEGLLGWLKTYGPLWTNGKKHIVVIAGLRGDTKRGFDVKVYDPWPGIGIGWRSLAGWYTGFNPGGNAASSRDTGNDVEAVFLRAP